MRSSASAFCFHDVKLFPFNLGCLKSNLEEDMNEADWMSWEDKDVADGASERYGQMGRRMIDEYV